MFEKIKRYLRVRKYVKKIEQGVIKLDPDVPAEYFDEVYKIINK